MPSSQARAIEAHIGAHLEPLYVALWSNQASGRAQACPQTLCACCGRWLKLLRWLDSRPHPHSPRPHILPFLLVGRSQPHLEVSSSPRCRCRPTLPATLSTRAATGDGSEDAASHATTHAFDADAAHRHRRADAARRCRFAEADPDVPATPLPPWGAPPRAGGGPAGGAARACDAHVGCTMAAVSGRASGNLTGKLASEVAAVAGRGS